MRVSGCRVERIQRGAGDVRERRRERSRHGRSVEFGLGSPVALRRDLSDREARFTSYRDDRDFAGRGDALDKWLDECILALEYPVEMPLHGGEPDTSAVLGEPSGAADGGLDDDLLPAPFHA